jgi:mannose-6-phosphate isomerase-like protein (cupin superfamily)
MTTTDTDTDTQLFNLRAPLLSSGNSDTPLYATDLMWAHVKVYAEGGENDLHAHPAEEHSFIVLDGEATFVDGAGSETVVHRNEGILLPKGTLYRFRNTGDTNLVMLRVGAGSNSRLPGKADERRGPDGLPLHNNPSQVALGRTKAVPTGRYFGEGDA